MRFKEIEATFEDHEMNNFKELNGAGNGARTRGIKLGKLALYQLSYSRLLNIIKELKNEIKWSFTGARVAAFTGKAPPPSGYLVSSSCSGTS